MPSKEHDDSSIISLRLPDGLLARLDRYLDWMESRQGEKSSRNHALPSPSGSTPKKPTPA